MRHSNLKTKLRREAYSISASVLRSFLSSDPDYISDNRTEEQTALLEGYISQIADLLEAKSLTSHMTKVRLDSVQY